MKLHFLYKSLAQGRHSKTYGYFARACEALGVEMVGYDFETKDPVKISDITELGLDDLLYRTTNDRLAKTAEQLMINDSCTHFYKRWKLANSGRGTSWFIHTKYGLPAIPSFPGIPNGTEELHAVVERLGGFPIIVKVVGRSLGVGVMRIDSMQSLVSVLDFLRTLEISVLLRKYIDHDHYVRAIVVGDRVVASHAAYAMKGEFRTNAGDDTDQKRAAIVLPEDLQQLVVQAVHTLGIETGGVDLLFDQEGGVYISEVNFPNNFTVTQKVTGIDIARLMVEYLIAKNATKRLG